MRKGNAEALERLKQRLESSQPAPDTDTQAPDTQAPDLQTPDT
jgi:hypothetical protein